jgi:hypothetical protein
MALQNAQLVQVQKTQTLNKKQIDHVGIVYDVILDETHPIAEGTDAPVQYIGCIQFQFFNKPNTDKGKCFLAYPYDKNYKSLPLRNEYVEIIQSETNLYYYKRNSFDITPNVNSSDTTISDTISGKSSNTQRDSDTYKKTSSTGIARSQNSDDEFDGYGEHFQATTDIHKLKLFEGDILFESRFGQSIRMSAYNNSDNKFSPSLILRNGENAESRGYDTLAVPSVENVNTDGGIIALTSPEVKSEFITDIQKDSDYFKEQLKKLEGHNQTLINSGRIIMSAKTAELMFFSKGDYGFRSDGGLYFQNGGGINGIVNDTITITTNDKNVNISSGTGHINLGDTDESKLEPIVKGDTLEKLLGELIDAINKQIFKTPSGPTAEGPENRQTFSDIKSRLKEIKSTLNKTS